MTGWLRKGNVDQEFGGLPVYNEELQIQQYKTIL